MKGKIHMEIAIVCFLGIWMISGSLIAYKQLKKDFSKEIERKEEKR